MGYKAIYLLPALLIVSIFLSGCGLCYDFDREPVDKNTSPVSGDYSTVREVIDGDTIILTNGETVRLIGINTPEEGRYFYDEAKEVMELLALGEQVRLEKDIDDVDKYGRLLRYIYTEDYFINLEMVKRGFANSYTYPPDVKYADVFLEAERYARENELGLWEMSKDYDIRVDVHYNADGDDSLNMNDEYVIIENMDKDRVDLKGWMIKDSGTNTYVFNDLNIEPGEKVYLFTGAGESFENNVFWNSDRPVWNNDGDTVYLRNMDGLLVTYFSYSG